jgi:multiple sugar transport system substrate-binding protein
LGYFTKAQPVTITYWGLWEDASIIQSTIGEFERLHPTIQVEYVKQSHVQYRERLQTQIEQNQGPDVFRFHNTWVPMIARDLSPVPASVMTPSAFASTFYPVASKDLVAGSTIYGMPMEIDGLGLYYNEDLLQAAGVTPPTTWEDVLNMVPQLTAKGSDGTITTSAIALGSANNVENFSDILATMIMQNGGSLTNPTGTETEQALTFFHNFADPANPVYTWNDGLDNSVFAFASGRVAMILAPSWRAFEIKQISPTLRFKIAPIPQLPGNSVSWASYWVEGVNAKGNHQEASWEFVKFLTSKEGATKMFTEASKLRLFGEPYARVDMKDSILNDQYVGAFVKDADHARSFPLASRTFDNGLNDHMIKYLVDAVNSMSQGSAPSSVLGTLEQGFQQVLGSYGLISNSAPTQ